MELDRLGLIADALVAGESTQLIPDLIEVGEFYGGLLRNPAWVKRRVETLSLVDSVRFERRTTLDVSTQAVVDSYRAVSSRDLDKVTIPVARLQKRLHLDVDARAGAADTISLVTSSVDSVVLTAVASVWIKENTHFLPHPEMHRIIESLYDVACDGTFQKSDGTTSPEVSMAFMSSSESLCESGLKRLLMRAQGFPELLRMLGETYLMMAELPVEPGITLVKTKILDTDPAVSSGFLASLMLGRSFYELEDSGLSTAASAHLRVDAPDGTELCSVDVYEKPSNRELEFVESRTTPSRAVIYGSGLSERARVVSVGLIPEFRKFCTLALASSLVGFTLLIGGWLLERYLEVCTAQASGVCQMHEGFVTNAADTKLDVLIAVLLTLPPLYALYLSRSGEHEIRSRLLRWPRRLLLVVGVAHGVVGGSLVIAGRLHDGVLEAILLCAAGACTISAAYVVAVYVVCARLQASVRMRIHQTSLVPIFSMPVKGHRGERLPESGVLI